MGGKNSKGKGKGKGKGKNRGDDGEGSGSDDILGEDAEPVLFTKDSERVR